MELFEILINEIYFQGITVLNELRNIYFIDSIDPKITKITVSEFNKAYFLYSETDPNQSKILKNVLPTYEKEENKDFDASVLCNYSKMGQIEIREFLVKIFLTLVSI